MFTLSLDEVGDFEGIVDGPINGYKPIFIGGVLYDDKENSSDLKTEKKRIRSYYKSVADEASKRSGRKLTYPSCLHVCKKASNEDVKYVKICVSETLGEFLKDGTFMGQKLKDEGNRDLPDRVGEYIVYVNLKSDDGKQKRIKENADFILKDNYSSNLYFHMISDTVGRTVFYNPLAENESSFDLNVATRSSITFDRNDNDNEIRNSYKTLKYKKVTTRGYGEKQVPLSRVDEDGNIINQERYEITNDDIYRTSVATYVADNNPFNVRVENLSVISIDYNGAGNDRNYKFEMLYMADSICSYLSFGLFNRKESKASKWLHDINARMCELVPEERVLLFAYDDIDILFSKAFEKMRNNNYYEALSMCYFSGNDDNAFVKYYKNKWFRYIEEKIIDSCNYLSFSKAVNDFYNAILSNNYHQGFGIYLYSILCKASEKVKNNIRTIEGQRPIAKLYECGMSVYCHLGDSANAEKCYNKLMSYSTVLTNDDLLRIRDILCVCYSDCFLWEKALKLSITTVKAQKSNVDIRNILLDKEMYSGSVTLGKAESQLGQMYAFSRDRHAQGCFLDALDNFEFGSANYFITLSYLLHYYLDIKDETGFNEYAKIYFGGKIDLEDILDYILEQGVSDDPINNTNFALYVFYKYIYTFKIDSVNKSLWGKIKNIEDYINNKCAKKLKSRWELGYHPAELIYKYIGLIAIHMKDDETIELCENNLINMSRYEFNTVTAIALIGVIDLYTAKDDLIKRRKYLNELIDKLKEKYKAFRNVKPLRDSNKTYELVKSYFTYMYN